MTSPATAAIGLAAHGAAVLAKITLSIPDRIGSPQATRFLGMFTWLTVQTNVICCYRFALVLVARFVGSDAIIALTVRMFPLSFGLGSMLTMLYYALDFFNPENVKKRKEFSKHVAPYCELAAHIEHGTALPVAVLDACTLAAHNHSRPAVMLPIGLYILLYMLQTIANHAATKVWQYPIIADVQRAAGWPGVLVLFAAIACLACLTAHLGVAIAGLDEWRPPILTVTANEE